MLYDQIQETLAFLRAKTTLTPDWGIVLGTGLSQLSHEMDIQLEVPYGEIPHFPESTVQSHSGKLLFGTLAGKPVVAMAGRFHFYEGYSMQQVTFPIRVMKALGVQKLLLSNAAGGINPHYQPGDIVFLRDHINLQPENPLRGVNDERLGPRFPDMLDTYHPELRKKALQIAQSHGFRAAEGVYVGLQGPNLETPAEYQFLHRMGGDLVGMSTVPEVLVARHSGIEVLAVSVVSNACYPLSRIQPTTVEDVIRVVEAAEPRLRQIVLELLQGE